MSILTQQSSTENNLEELHNFLVILASDRTSLQSASQLMSHGYSYETDQRRHSVDKTLAIYSTKMNEYHILACDVYVDQKNQSTSGQQITTVAIRAKDTKQWTDWFTLSPSRFSCEITTQCKH